MTAATGDRVEQNVSMAKLVLYEGNPRRGSVEFIRSVMVQLGWWGAAVGQLSSRRVLVGNHRIRAWCEPDPAIGWKGHKTVPLVHWRDVDDETAAAMLMADNRANDLASTDPFDALKLLEDLPDHLRGLLQFGDGEMDAMRSLVHPPALDDLVGQAGKYSDAEGSAFWPRIALQVDPDVHARWQDAWTATADVGDDDSARLGALLDRLS